MLFRESSDRHCAQAEVLIMVRPSFHFVMLRGASWRRSHVDDRAAGLCSAAVAHADGGLLGIGTGEWCPHYLL